MSKILKQGPKAKQGNDKVSALRNQFDAYATRFASCEFSINEEQATKLGIVMDAAEATNNNEVAIAAMSESFKVALLASGNAEQSARSRTSEAMRIVGAYYLTVGTKTDKDGKITLHKLKDGERGHTGKTLLMKAGGFHKAAALATKIKTAAGIAKRGGPKSKAVKAAEKVWTKGDAVDAIDTLIKQVRVMAGVPADVIERLLQIKAMVKGAPIKVSSALKSADHAPAPVLTNQQGKAVVKGSKAWQAMSRGQKAAASRRAHAGVVHTIQ